MPNLGGAEDNPVAMGGVGWLVSARRRYAKNVKRVAPRFRNLLVESGRGNGGDGEESGSDPPMKTEGGGEESGSEPLMKTEGGVKKAEVIHS